MQTAGQLRRVSHNKSGRNKSSTSTCHGLRRRVCVVRATLPSITTDKIVQAAFKEPVAFLGGLFAGILNLNVKEDPLRTWIERTSEDAGVSQLTRKESSKPGLE